MFRIDGVCVEEACGRIPSNLRILFLWFGFHGRSKHFQTCEVDAFSRRVVNSTTLVLYMLLAMRAVIISLHI